MDVEAFNQNVLEVIEEFDRSCAPFGLYAVRDTLLESEPQHYLHDFPTLIERRPELVSVHWFHMQLCQLTHWAKPLNSTFRWLSHDFGSVELRIARISKIKVRKFGSNYRIDKHESFPTRWEAMKLDREISQLWAQGGYRQKSTGLQMLLFLGFDKAEQPFEREFSQLKPHQNHQAHGATFTSRQWKDPHDRQFFVRAAIWSLPNGQD